MDNDLISRSALIKRLEGIYKMDENEPIKTYANAIRLAIGETKLAPTVETVQAITGDTSDGYHTFNELYHHRAVLFSVIVKAFPERAWKARQHHDGTMYDGMFIVGIDTPNGQASYHYDIGPYWDMFDCRELERAPEWDGHTPAQAIERIGMLEPVRHGHWDHCKGKSNLWYCSVCGEKIIYNPTRKTYGPNKKAVFEVNKRCRSCGAKMDGREDPKGHGDTL